MKINQTRDCGEAMQAEYFNQQNIGGNDKILAREKGHR